MICRPKKAKIIALTLMCVDVVKNVHVFWTRGPQEIIDSKSNSTYIKVCGKPTPEFAYFSNFIRPWIVFTLASFLPTCFLLVCNLWIVAELAKCRKENLGGSNKKDKTHRQMTAMCLGVSFVFIVCTIPSIVILIGRPWWSKSSPEGYTFAKGINNLLLFVNHSINFIMYSVTGKKFREETRAVISCKKDLGNRRTSNWDRRMTTRLTDTEDHSIDHSENVPLTNKNQMSPVKS